MSRADDDAHITPGRWRAYVKTTPPSNDEERIRRLLTKLARCGPRDTMRLAWLRVEAQKLLGWRQS